MKSLKDLLKSNKERNIYQKLNYLINNKDNNKLLNKEDTINKEFKVGIITIIILIFLISSILYYLLIFQPQMTQLQEHKNIKISQLNSLFPESTSQNSNKQAIISQIESASSIEMVDSIDIYAQAKPLLINQLNEDISQQKDKYDRILLKDENSSKIFSTDDAKKYIKTLDPTVLATINASTPDTVIVPLNLNRKQSASGFITQGDTVDIYKKNEEYQSTSNEEYPENANYNSNNSSNINNSSEVDNSTQQIPVDAANDSNSSIIVGGAKIISILRSKESTVVDSNIELNQYPHSRNYTQTSKVDIQEVIEAKASGTLDESKLKVLFENYGYNLSKYERISNIGDLDCEYIILIEVPRDSVDQLINNMDSLILTIPTTQAPSWVKLN